MHPVTQRTTEKLARGQTDMKNGNPRTPTRNVATAADLRGGDDGEQRWQFVQRLL